MGHKEGADVIARGVNTETGETVITMYGPPSALSADADGLSQFLYALSELVIRGLLPDQRGGGLGGEFGYGVNYESDVFMLHPYCWCEKRDCLWCCIWLSNEEDCTEQESNAHRDAQEQAVREKYGAWAAEYPGAPHFWFKPTGFQARWYKWIGRDMKISGDLTAEQFREMVEACWASIPEEAKKRADEQIAHESTPEYKAEQERAYKAMSAAIAAMLRDGER